MQFRSANDFKKVVAQDTQEIILSEEVTFTWHLKKLVDERELKLAELASITGIQAHTLSRYANNNQAFNTVSLVHVFALMIALRITDMSELFTIEFPNNTVERFNEEAEEWKQTKVMPYELYALLKKNKG